jgi:hypothetical protein
MYCLAGLSLTAQLFSMSAYATYNATVVGTVVTVQQMSTSLQYTPETFTFTISTQPTVACGSGFNYFVVSPATVTDAQTRKNFLAMLLTAKAAGASVQVAYDSTGGFCDQGMTAVYYLVVL